MQSLTVPGTLDSLSAIAEFVMVAAKQAGLDKKAAYRFRLAVDEIATNIIVHGYEEANYEGDINLLLDIDAQALTLTLEDTGVAYDPNQHLLPEAASLGLPLDQRPTGGLGIYLALQGVDKFVYERVENRNRNTLIMNRPKPVANP
jgi:anti-sigma regulatory factor (Ser/Thr protein kinase)